MLQANFEETNSNHASKNNRIQQKHQKQPSLIRLSGVGYIDQITP
jgi:hypothetical protein